MSIGYLKRSKKTRKPLGKSDNKAEERGVRQKDGGGEMEREAQIQASDVKREF